MELLQVLSNTELFNNIPTDVIEQLILPSTQLRKFPQGSNLIMPQDCISRISVVLSGIVHIQHIFSDGSYSLMNVLERGELVGADLSATKSHISPYFAVAASDVTVALLPENLLDNPNIPEAHRHKIGQNLLRIISNENMKKEYRLAILSRSGLRERVVAYLTMQSAKRGNNSFTVPFSREEMASYLCVNRSCLSHELSKMRQEGLLDFHKNSFTLLKTGTNQP